MKQSKITKWNPLSKPETTEPPEQQSTVRPLSSTPTPEVSTGRSSAGQSRVGKSLRFKGTLSGLEDLYVDSEVEGTIDLQDKSLTVGPDGSVNANIKARHVTVLGKVTGSVVCLERIRICKSGSLEGDVRAPRIIIEDGAVFRGNVEVVKTKDVPEEVLQTNLPSIHRET